VCNAKDKAMRLPPARVTVPLAEVWRHWRVTELVTGFSRPAGFDVGWSLAGRVRGALGHALLGEGAVTRRHGVPSAFDVLFGDPAVMPAGDGALFANPTRPFVMLADASGERVEVRLRLFGWAAVLSRELAVALARGLEAGISLAPGARTRARIEADPVRRLEPRIEPPAAHAGGVHITFLSPVAFEREGAMAADRDMLVSSLMARLAGLVVELRLDKRTQILNGTWRWRMQDHILIINSPAQGAERYFVRLLGQLRADPDFARVPVQILTERFADGLPAAIRELGAVHYSGSAHDSEVLKAVGVTEARHIILLAPDETDPRSDSLNFDVLLELHEIYTGAKITVEVVDDGGRARFRRFGAHTVLRPARAYPEMVVRAITAPGAERVIEDLMTPSGSVTRRYNLRIENSRWSDVVRVLMERGLGTALAYVSESREVVPNPAPDEVVSGRGIILLAQAASIPDRDRVRDALAPLRSA